ncbi:MAG: hypothetical protein A2293_10330 [Elusimicrobia bacterium RIFOXYB2_FULL_49_7]|nr:MAG: hypothetical protein A2293_10330 [Elusimicrobia bacterium RIFOXYB2_FULL_49_7]
MKYARDYALNEGKYYCIEFDIPHRQYWLSVNKGSLGSTDFAPFKDSLHKTRSWPDNIRLENLSAYQLVFYPDGTCQDFTMTLKNDHGNTCILQLKGSTGRTEINSI